MEPSAVDFLLYYLPNSIKGQFKEQIAQAKRMEKEQKIEFAVSCLQSNSCFFDIEEYYNKTFKSEQAEDTLKLVLNDIERTPEEVFNKQWESIKKTQTK